MPTRQGLGNFTLRTEATNAFLSLVCSVIFHGLNLASLIGRNRPRFDHDSIIPSPEPLQLLTLRALGSRRPVLSLLALIPTSFVTLLPGCYYPLSGLGL